MIYSRTWQYAMRILLRLARLPPAERISASRVADEARLPTYYCGKILSTLTGAGLVSSRRGPRGGVRLARAAREISLRDVGDALGEETAVGKCILGFRRCSDDDPCPIHPTWAQMRPVLVATLLDRSLDDFHDLANDLPVVEPTARPQRARRPSGLDDELL